MIDLAELHAVTGAFRDIKAEINLEISVKLEEMAKLQAELNQLYITPMMSKAFDRAGVKLSGELVNAVCEELSKYGSET